LAAEDPREVDGLGIGIGPGVSLELMHLSRVPARVEATAQTRKRPFSMI